MARKRQNATPAQQEAQLQRRREQQAARQAQLSQEEREQEAEVERTRKATQRANENETQRQKRLAADRSRHAQQATARRTNPKWLREGFNYDNQKPYADAASLGEMTRVCKHETCQAKMFHGETKGMCCKDGKVPNLIPKAAPEPLKSLLEDGSKEAKDFRKLTRAYNSAFQMTSFGAGAIIREGNFMPTYKVQGQVHHTVGSLLPLQNESHKFLQLYFVGNSQAQAEKRQSAVSNMSKDTKIELILQLQEMLHKCNPYVKDFKYVLESHKHSPDYKVVINETKRPAGSHKGRYNEQACNEVAVVIAGGTFGSNRDIVLETRDKQLKRITETHRSYDALQYPLLLP